VRPSLPQTRPLHLLFALALPGLVACADAGKGGAGLVCGEGTVEQDGACVADEEADADADSDADADADSDADSDADADADADADSDADADADSDADADADTDRKAIAYFTEWGIYDRGYQVEDLPADQLTHLNYAFVNLTPDGQCVVYDSWAALEREGGNFAKLVDLKAAHPHLRTLMSVGGWTLSTHFPAAAATPEARARFAESCVDFMVTYGFDGIDIDWEWPVSGGLTEGTPADRENFTLLLQAVRAELDLLGGEHLLTVATAAGVDKIGNIEPAAIADVVDWINIMSYDYHGGWELRSHFNAPLYAGADFPAGATDPWTVDGSVQAYLAAGVPPEQLVVGLPFYGRGWSGVSTADNGLFQTATGLPWGTWENGVFDYWDIADDVLLRAGCARHWHEEAMVPWVMCSDGTFISYDDEESISAKLDYIEAQGLGGAMYWSIDGDHHDDPRLVQLVADRMIAAP
jgi:chitinase